MGSSAHWSSSVYHDGHLNGLFGFKQWEQVPLKCIELATGEEKWSSDGFGQGGVILTDGSLVALAENGDTARLQRNGAAQGCGREMLE